MATTIGAGSARSNWRNWLADLFGTDDPRQRQGFGGILQNFGDSYQSFDAGRQKLIHDLAMPGQAIQRGLGELLAAVPGVAQANSLQRDENAQIEQMALPKMLYNSIAPMAGLPTGKGPVQDFSRSMGTGLLGMATDPTNLLNLHPATMAAFVPDLVSGVADSTQELFSPTNNDSIGTRVGNLGTALTMAALPVIGKTAKNIHDGTTVPKQLGESLNQVLDSSRDSPYVAKNDHAATARSVLIDITDQRNDPNSAFPDSPLYGTLDTADVVAADRFVDGTLQGMGSNYYKLKHLPGDRSVNFSGDSIPAMAYAYEMVKGLPEPLRKGALATIAKVTGDEDFIPDDTTAPPSFRNAKAFIAGYKHSPEFMTTGKVPNDLMLSQEPAPRELWKNLKQMTPEPPNSIPRYNYVPPEQRPEISHGLLGEVQTPFEEAQYREAIRKVTELEDSQSFATEADSRRFSNASKLASAVEAQEFNPRDYTFPSVSGPRGDQVNMRGFNKTLPLFDIYRDTLGNVLPNTRSLGYGLDHVDFGTVPPPPGKRVHGFFRSTEPDRIYLDPSSAAVRALRDQADTTISDKYISKLTDTAIHEGVHQDTGFTHGETSDQFESAFDSARKRAEQSDYVKGLSALFQGGKLRLHENDILELSTSGTGNRTNQNPKGPVEYSTSKVSQSFIDKVNDLTNEPKDIIMGAKKKYLAANRIAKLRNPQASPTELRTIADQYLTEAGIPPKIPKAMQPDKPGNGRQNPIESFEDWVGARQEADVLPEVIAKRFGHLKDSGEAGLHTFEADNAAHPELAEYFSKTLQDQQDAGINVTKLDNYLHHTYEDNPAALSAFKKAVKQLSLAPGHSKSRQLATYQLAEQFGLKPKYKNLADIAGAYEKKARTSIADRDFFNYLKDSGQVKTRPEPGWEKIPNFPKATTKSRATGKVALVEMYAPQELAKKINNYFAEPNKTIGGIAQLAGLQRNLVLGAGIPGTWYNAHGINLANRFMKSGESLKKGIADTIALAKDPLGSGSTKYISENIEKAPYAVRHGLTLNIPKLHFDRLDQTLSERLASTTESGIDLPGFRGKALGQAKEIIETAFDRPLFERIIPHMKLKRFYEIYESMISGDDTPASKKQAAITAAETVNTLFSGQNIERMGRSKDVQNTLRILLLAPDWAESNVKLAKNIVAPNPGAGPVLRSYARRFATVFLAQQLFQYATSGKTVADTGVNRAFNLYAGKKDDKHSRFLTPFMTAEDWARIPIELVGGLASGDETAPTKIINNRISPLINLLIGTIQQRDYAGRKISGIGVPAGRALVNNLDMAVESMAPPQVLAGIEAAKHIPPIEDWLAKNKFDKPKSIEEIVEQALELPVRIVASKKKVAEDIGPLDFRKSATGKPVKKKKKRFPRNQYTDE